MTAMRDVYRTDAGRLAVQQWCQAKLAGWPVAHECSQILTSVGRTHLVQAGSGPVTVLFLPGTNFNAATSLDLIALVAEQHRVVAADLPGQPGLSAASLAGEHALAARRLWIREVIASLETDFLILVGHSLGAAVALTADPQQVSGLVLIDPAGLIRLRVSPIVLASTLAWLAKPTAGSSARMLRMMTAPGRRPRDDLVEWMTLVARHTRPRGAPAPLSAEELSPWKGTPRVALSGQRDCFLPVSRLAAATRNRLAMDVDVLPRAGHLTPVEDPQRLTEAIATLAPRPD
jgi:pimeloyl-ACP methyl ester carboxylesterase